MTLEQKIDLLLANQITETAFSSVIVKSNVLQGQPIGQGACKAVILRANKFLTYSDAPDTYNGDAGVGGRANKFYYGDSKQQTFEYLLNVDNANRTLGNTKDSEIIYCKDLSDVWVRQFNNENVDIEIQILIYR
jgi:hypothetical protein